MRFVHDDGGRARAGFRGDAGDCVTRAIAIASGIPYREVYDELALRMQRTGKSRSARNGVPRKVYDDFLRVGLDFTWHATMAIGSGCRVHLVEDELPDGHLVVRLSKHLTAVVDGVIRDNHDPSRDGTRCVYGYYRKEG